MIYTWEKFNYKQFFSPTVEWADGNVKSIVKFYFRKSSCDCSWSDHEFSLTQLRIFNFIIHSMRNLFKQSLLLKNKFNRNQTQVHVREFRCHKFFTFSFSIRLKFKAHMNYYKHSSMPNMSKISSLHKSLNLWLCCLHFSSCSVLIKSLFKKFLVY
jgi:hypothetical protein